MRWLLSGPALRAGMAERQRASLETHFSRLPPSSKAGDQNLGKIACALTGLGVRKRLKAERKHEGAKRRLQSQIRLPTRIPLPASGFRLDSVSINKYSLTDGLTMDPFKQVENKLKKIRGNPAITAKNMLFLER